MYSMPGAKDDSSTSFNLVSNSAKHSAFILRSIDKSIKIEALGIFLHRAANINVKMTFLVETNFLETR
jgi:hypothetical protein